MRKVVQAVKNQLPGAFVGVVIGVLLMLLALRVPQLNLEGTSANPEENDELARVVPASYFLVGVPETGEWLGETYEDLEDAPETIAVAAEEIDKLAELPTVQEFREGVKESEDYINTLLYSVESAVQGEKEIDIEKALEEEDERVAEDEDALICLGIEDNPYEIEGPKLYVYMRIHEDQMEEVNDNLPEDWEPLEESKENDLYWSLLACRPNLDEPTEA